MSDKKLRVYESIDDVNEGQWNNTVKQSGRGSVFHRTGWLKAVEHGLGLDARHLVLEKKGHPMALVPNFVREIDLPVSVPDALDGLTAKRLVSIKPGFGGPLVMGSERSNFDLLFENADALFADRTLLYHRMEIADDRFMRYATHFARHGYQAETTSCLFTIDLEKGWDAIESEMKGSKRSNVADARDSGATVREPTFDEDAVEEFYGEYEAAMERVGGIVHPFSFFDVLREELADRIKLFTVEVDGEFAGGRLYLLDDERSAVRSFFQGLNSDFFDYHPSELLDEHAIRWGIENGYEEYGLGSTRGDFDDGAFKYKSELGARPRPVLGWEKGYSAVGWPAYRYGRKLLRSRS